MSVESDHGIGGYPDILVRPSDAVRIVRGDFPTVGKGGERSKRDVAGVFLRESPLHKQEQEGCANRKQKEAFSALRSGRRGFAPPAKQGKEFWLLGFEFVDGSATGDAKADSIVFFMF